MICNVNMIYISVRMSVEKDNEVRDFWVHCGVSLLRCYAAYIGSYRRFGTPYFDNGADRLSLNFGKKKVYAALHRRAANIVNRNAYLEVLHLI